MTYPLTFYTTHFVKHPHAATTYGPCIFIDPAYRHDLGLIAHEREHVAQWFCTLGLSSFLYLFSKRFRLWSEVQCYRVQLKYSPGREELFASFIAERYGLDITKEEALKELSK